MSALDCTDTLGTALWLAGKGFHIFPVDHPELSACIGLHTQQSPCDGTRGKHPAAKFSRTATTDPKMLSAWFSARHRNLGIACKPSRLVVLDEDAEGELDRWSRDHQVVLPPTFAVVTARGLHYYFTGPAGVEIGNGEKPFTGYAINVRGYAGQGGGYVVAPGSLHADGHVYHPLDPDAEVAVLPTVLATALSGKEKIKNENITSKKASSNGEFTTPAPPARGDPNTTKLEFKHRHHELIAYAGRLRKAGLDLVEAEPTFQKRWLKCVQPIGLIPEATFHEVAPDDCDYPVTWEEAKAKLWSVYGLYPAGETGEPKPIPLVVTEPLPAFPIDSIPEPIKAMVKATSMFCQTDEAMAGTVALGVLSACAAGRVIAEVRGSWTEPLCIYAVVSSAPGTRKSPVFAAMTSPLVVAEKELVSAGRPKEIEARTQKKIATEAAHRAEKSAASGKDNAKGISEAISEAMFAEAIAVPAQPRILADDVTAEALASLLAAHGGRIAIMSAEGGIFDTLAGRYSSGVPNLDTLLKGWSAEPVRVDRRGAPSEYVEKACITMLLTVQPSVLMAIARNGAFRGRGLLARFLFSLPPNNVGHRQVGTAPIEASIADEYATCIRTLAVDLEQWAGDPAKLLIDPAAAKLLLDLEGQLEPRLGRDGDLGVIADWGSKAVGQTVRLAGLLHLVAGKKALVSPIGENTMRSAIALTDYYAAHAKQAFVAMGADETTANAMFVLDELKREHMREFTVRNLHMKLGTNRFPKVDALKEALDLLADHHWISLMPELEHAGRGRKPSPTYVTQFTVFTE